MSLWLYGGVARYMTTNAKIRPGPEEGVELLLEEASRAAESMTATDGSSTVGDMRASAVLDRGEEASPHRSGKGTPRER